jgi:DNA-binding transcriptional regulator YiaG
MKKYKSEIKTAIHQDAALLHEAGLISDEKMRHFDEACLVKPSMPQGSTQKPSAFAHSSVPVFASNK